MHDRIGGYDRRRRSTRSDRQAQYATVGGLCQNCGRELGVDWHMAHMNAWANGGSTTTSNMRVWCRDCNLKAGAIDIGVEQVTPRGWQAQALPIIVDRLFETGVATVQAAPGAGKTIFAGLVFLELARAGLVDRMVVVVPRANLVTQWRRSLGEALRLHLDDEPRDNVLEHPLTKGAIVSYQSLPGAAVAHRAELDHRSTLIVLDEVHHLGREATWGKAVGRMVGDINADDGIAAAGVLNLTGILPTG